MVRFGGPPNLQGLPSPIRQMWEISTSIEGTLVPDEGALPPYVHAGISDLMKGKVSLGSVVFFGVVDQTPDRPILKTGLVLHPVGSAQHTTEYKLDTVSTENPDSRTLRMVAQTGFEPARTISSQADLRPADVRFISRIHDAIVSKRTS